MAIFPIIVYSIAKGRRTLADFLSADKKSSLVGKCAVNSDKSATRSGLVGRNLAVLDLKTSRWALSANVRWTETICRGSLAPQPIRKCHDSHVSRIGAILVVNDPVPSLNTVSRDKKSATVGQADGPTNFNSIWLRQKICSSTTKNRLVCGSLN